MSEPIAVGAPFDLVVRTLGRASAVSMQTIAGGRCRADLGIEPEPLQIARAERALVRRGYFPSLAAAVGKVRLDVRGNEESCAIRYERFVRIGAAQVEMSEQQRAGVEAALRAVAAAVEAAVSDRSARSA